MTLRKMSQKSKSNVENGYEAMEKKYGVDFFKTIKVEDMDNPYPTTTNSGPSRYNGLQKTIDELDIEKGSKVLDIGCGKGAAMALFLQNENFTQVDGVEYTKSIADIAKSNMDKLRASKSTVYNEDAVAFTKRTDIDRYNYFYLYDPFRGFPLVEVFKHIEASYRRSPRHITIIYANPHLSQHVPFPLYKTVKTDFHIPEVNVYRV